MPTRSCSKHLFYVALVPSLSDDRQISLHATLNRFVQFPERGETLDIQVEAKDYSYAAKRIDR
jgi:hypothetical protein